MAKFKVGDKVRHEPHSNPQNGTHRADVNVTYAIDRIVDDDDDIYVFLVEFPGVAWFADRFELVESAPTLLERMQSAAVDDHQAMRFNNSKSDLAYFLSFDGGPEMLFPEMRVEDGTTSRFHEAAIALGEWYRTDYLMDERFETLLGEFRAVLDPQWPEQAAAVCQFGAKKYARGNYLKGRGLHDTCNSLLRHMLQIERGEDVDDDSKCKHDGHIAWNLAFLRHCYRTFGAKFDDRLRAPKIEPAKPAAAVPDQNNPKVGDLFRSTSAGGGLISVGAVYRVTGKSKNGYFLRGCGDYDVSITNKNWWEPVASDYAGMVFGEPAKPTFKGGDRS